MKSPIIIGTRGSELAIWQANNIQAKLRKLGAETRIKIIKTQGDKVQDLSFDKLEGKGFFTKELEDALLANEIDLAVHSYKDLPSSAPEGLAIVALTEREDPSELFLIRPESVDLLQPYKLKIGAKVGTSSTRRKSQLWAVRPDINILDLRGNVPTRIKKLRDGNYDAILLAFAGVQRIKADISGLETMKISPKEFLPAPAQGVLAIQIRVVDTELSKFIRPLNDALVQATVGVERELLRLLNGGCQIPLGVFVEKSKEKYQLWASSAEKASQIPKRIFLSGTKPAELAQLAIQKIQERREKSVFITRKINEGEYLSKVLKAYNYSIHGESLIQVKPLKFTNIQPTDWIFFTSKNGVRYFFSQIKELGFPAKLAVSGKGTERALNECGYTADFVGVGSNIELVGKEFSKIAEGQSILFPQSADSLQTIQKQLTFSSRVINLLVYQINRKKDVKIPDADIVVITSPSNTDVYFGRGIFPKYQHLIAIGESTAARIESYKIKGFSIANQPDEMGIAEMIFSV